MRLGNLKRSLKPQPHICMYAKMYSAVVGVGRSTHKKYEMYTKIYDRHFDK